MKAREFYILEDGIELHRNSPHTFQIPSIQKKVALKKGDIVKLIFNQDKRMTERMWVIITKAKYPNYEGTLDNNPLFIDTIKYGDKIKFHANNIVNTYD
jgi:uncharacterized protein YegJ (DUF2314 family)